MATVNFTLLYLLMRRETAHLETRALFATFAKLLVPTALLAAVCWGARLTLLANWAHFALPVKAALLIVTIAVAGAAFFGSAALLKVEEMGEVQALVLRKLKRTPRG